MKAALIAALTLALSAGAACADPPAPPAQTAPIQVGALTLSGAFLRAPLPGAPVAAGYLTIANTGPDADRLTGASAAFAGRVEVHDMAMAGDVMQMRALPGGLPVPPQASVTLKPGGIHLMFMDLHRTPQQGQTETVTLTFEKAGAVVVAMPVLSPSAQAAN